MIVLHFSDRDGKLTKENLEQLLDAIHQCNAQHDKKLIAEKTEKLFNALGLDSENSITESEFVDRLRDKPELRRIIVPAD